MIEKFTKDCEITKKIYELIRKDIATVEDDGYFGPDIEHIYEIVREGQIFKTTEDLTGELKF